MAWIVLLPAFSKLSLSEAKNNSGKEKK